MTSFIIEISEVEMRAGGGEPPSYTKESNIMGNLIKIVSLDPLTQRAVGADLRI